ncbi:MAG: 3-hydroxyacyl-ACP dehydratase FabZ family protein [Pirellulales bacterium]
MAGKDLILQPSEYDLGNVIADLEEIRKFNLQRFEMEQLTAICHIDRERQTCVGYKDVTHDEFWCRGHMPGMPLMPGVIMCEAAAQLCSYLVQKFNLLGTRAVGFGGLDEVKFRGPVRPGSRLVLMTQLTKSRPNVLIMCRFQGLVDNAVVVEGIMKGVPLPKEFSAGT